MLNGRSLAEEGRRRAVSQKDCLRNACANSRRSTSLQGPFLPQLISSSSSCYYYYYYFSVFSPSLSAIFPSPLFDYLFIIFYLEKCYFDSFPRSKLKWFPFPSLFFLIYFSIFYSLDLLSILSWFSANFKDSNLFFGSISFFFVCFQFQFFPKFWFGSIRIFFAHNLIWTYQTFNNYLSPFPYLKQKEFGFIFNQFWCASMIH